MYKKANRIAMNLIITLFISLAGCAATQTQYGNPSSVIPTDETASHPDYVKYYTECDIYAQRITADVAKSATSGALAGDLSSAAGTKISNDQRYKQIMLRCLRERCFEVY